MLKALAHIYVTATLVGGVAALIIAIANPTAFEDLWSRRTRAAVSGWLFAFALPFSVIIFGDKADRSYSLIGIILLVGLLAALVAARHLPPNWALLGGAVMTVGFWIAWSWGYWETHVLGLNGRSVDNLASDDMGTGAYWVGVIIFAFVAVLPGLVAGSLSLIHRHPPSRRIATQRHAPLEHDPHT